MLGQNGSASTSFSATGEQPPLPSQFSIAVLANVVMGRDQENERWWDSFDLWQSRSKIGLALMRWRRICLSSLYQFSGGIHGDHQGTAHYRRHGLRQYLSPR